MKNLRLRRVVMGKKCVQGVLHGGDCAICCTLEPPWKDNQHDVSCIPVGTYLCKKIISPKYGKVWEVENVPNRSEILFGHLGNTAKDTKGCILLGLSFDMFAGEPAVRDSRKAILRFWEVMEDEDSMLEIVE